MHYREIIETMLSGRFLGEKDINIECDNSLSIAYKDLIELYLFLSRSGKWNWVDSKGNSLPGQSCLSSASKLILDCFLWPFMYLKRSQDVRRLERAHISDFAPGKLSSVLFLRTDHWFNIKSGGSVGHLKGVIHGFRSLGLETHVASSDFLAGVANDAYFHLCAPSCVRGRNIPNFPEFLYNEQVLEFVDGQWSRWAPSIIYQRYSLGNYVGVLLKQKYRVPFVCEFNGSFPWIARNWEGRKLIHEALISRIEILNLKAADLVVVVSEPMKDELAARGIETRKILVNPNGVDPVMYSPEIDGSIIRGKLSLGTKIVVGFIGTFGPWHGAEVLVDAFGILLRNHPELRGAVTLLMIGDGAKMPEVKEIIKRRNIADAVVLTGLTPQEEGPAHLAACDILASPHVPNPDGTAFFGSPTKLFEYMAMGKAIVASDLDQIGEVLEHGRTALMVEPGDAEALARGMKNLVDNSDLRKKLGAAARQEALSKYTWQEHTRRIIDKLEECFSCS